MMEILIYIIFAVGFFVLGYLSRGIGKKTSGRLVINEEADEFFVAITDKPEDIAKKKSITLKVFITKGRRER